MIPDDRLLVQSPCPDCVLLSGPALAAPGACGTCGGTRLVREVLCLHELAQLCAADDLHNWLCRANSLLKEMQRREGRHLAVGDREAAALLARERVGLALAARSVEDILSRTGPAPGAGRARRRRVRPGRGA